MCSSNFLDFVEFDRLSVLIIDLNAYISFDDFSPLKLVGNYS